MAKNIGSTNDGTKGGLLKGKRHYDKDGKPLGGIKAIVTDTGQMVELEGGEVIINREASKKHWRELSRINQSAGNGVPILPPDVVEDDTEEYKNGGNTIEFNPNKTPTKWVYEYAVKIKEKYPKVWNIVDSKLTEEAFNNLANVYKRGYWLDGEEWFYYKWSVFNQKYKDATSLAGVLTSLKWCNINKKGWRYMKGVIEKAIAKHYPKKFSNGGKFPILTEDSKKNLAPVFIDERLPKNKGVGSVVLQDKERTLFKPEDINKILKNVGLPFRVTKDIGMGLYGNAYTTDRDSVLKVTYSAKEAYASFMIMQGGYESQVKTYNVFKVTDALNNSLYFIEKELVKVAEQILEELQYPFSEYYKNLYSWLEPKDFVDKLGKNPTDEDIKKYAKKYYSGFEIRESLATNLQNKKNKLATKKDKREIAILETQIESINEFFNKKEQVIQETYNYLKFLEKIVRDKEDITIDDYHTRNFGKVGDKYVCFDCVMGGFREFMSGGKIPEVYFVEADTKDGKKVYKYFDYKPTDVDIYNYFNKTKDIYGNPVKVIESTIKKQEFSGFNLDTFLDYVDKIATQNFGAGIKNREELIISFDKNTFEVTDFDAELKNGKKILVKMVDGVIQVEETFGTGGMMDDEPPANFENVLWDKLASRYKHGGSVGIIVCDGCGWNWQPEESETHDLYECHKCHHDNTNKYMKKKGGTITWKHKYNKKYGYDKEESHDLKEISKDTGVSLKGLQQIYNKGVGAYNTNPQSVRPNVTSEEQWAMGRVYSAVMGGKASKIDANELKMEDGGEVPQHKSKIGELTRLSMKPFAFKEKLQFIKENPEILAGKFFKDGGELAKGIKTEKEHADTIKKIYDHKVPLSKAPELIAKDHIEENPKYYTELQKMEQKFAGGGNISTGDRVTFYQRGATEPTYAVVLKKGTCNKNGKCNAYIKFEGSNKRLLVYEDRLTKVGEQVQAQPTPTTLVTQTTATPTRRRQTEWNFEKNVWQFYRSPNNDTKILLAFDKMQDGNLYYTDAIFITNTGDYVKNGFINDAEVINNMSLATEVEIQSTFEDYFSKNKIYKNGDIISNVNLGFDRSNYEIQGRYENLSFNINRSSNGGYNIVQIYADEGTALIYDQYRKERFAKIKNITHRIVQPAQQPTITDDFDETAPAPETFFNYTEDSKLNFIQQSLIRTKAFKDWFGDWETARKMLSGLGENANLEDYLRIYRGVSKAINSQTKEPTVMYHGTKAQEEFFVFEANRNDKGRPYAYFAENREYSLNFTRFSQRGATGGKRLLYQCFLQVKNPFYARFFAEDINLRLNNADYWKKWIAERLYKYHKIGISLNRMRDVVESQIGAYIDDICQKHGNADKKILFWYLMAQDTQSKFKYFLISHKFDSIMYNEESTMNMTTEDYANPEKFTRAFAVFDSYQIKLADGRNINFEELNPDIRFEDGGNLPQNEQPVLTKKDEIGALLFGEKYILENGGNLHTKGNEMNKQIVEHLINKMK